MNTLQNHSKTMSSREIAELTGKDHKNVLRTLRNLIDQSLVAQIEPLKYEYKGQSFPYYELGKRDSLVLVARLSPEFTAAIVDRWQELENQLPALPQTFAEALQLAADQAKQLEEAKPKLAVYDTLADRKDDINTTALAKQLGTSAIKLNKFFKEKRIKFKHQDLPQSPYSEWFNVIPIVAGKHESYQCLITPKGVLEITKRWNKFTEQDA